MLCGVFIFRADSFWAFRSQYSRISQAGYSERDYLGYPRVCWAHYFRWIPSTFCSSIPIKFSEQSQFRLSKRVESIWTSPTNALERFTIPHKLRLCAVATTLFYFGFIIWFQFLIWVLLKTFLAMAYSHCCKPYFLNSKKIYIE